MQVLFITGGASNDRDDISRVDFSTHGPIENMKMPPITMAFPVQDPSVLLSLKEESKVKFALENVNGVPTITLLVPQK